MAAEWRNIILGFQSESGSGRLLRELAPTRLHVLFCVFLKVDVSRARDDRFRGPETSRNSKPPKVGVSRRRNTCLWEAISTNVQNFVQPEAEPHKGLAMAWQMPRQDVFLRHLDHRVHFSHPGRIASAAEPVPKSPEFRLVFQWVLLASARGAPSEISGSAAGVPKLKAHPHMYIAQKH